MKQWKLIQVDAKELEVLAEQLRDGRGTISAGLLVAKIHESPAIPENELKAVNSTRKLLRELAQTKRLLRRVVRKANHQGATAGVTTYVPEVRPLFDRAKKVRLRLERVRACRKARLLREMRPEDLRALGLTPPPEQKVDVYKRWKKNAFYPDRCQNCMRPVGEHKAVTLECPSKWSTTVFLPNSHGICVLCRTVRGKHKAGLLLCPAVP